MLRVRGVLHRGVSCVQVPQRAVDVLRSRSTAPAWAAVGAVGHPALINPAEVVLTAEPEAPLVAALQRRGRRSMRGSAADSGSARSSADGGSCCTRASPASAVPSV